jgi:transcriptional regulator with XRE-family HTH domain
MDYNQFLKRLGSAVRQRRIDNNKTQESVAHDLGVHQSNLSKLEKGDQGFDSRTLFDLAQSLGTPLHQLFRLIEKPAEGGDDLDQRIELLSDQEREMVKFFRSCNGKGKEILLTVASMTSQANPQGANVVALTQPKKKRDRVPVRKSR